MKQNRASINFSYIGIGRFVSIFIQALFYLLFAKLLEPDIYGELNVILALAGTFAIISRLGLAYTLQVYQSKKESELSDRVKTLFLLSTGAASVILLSIDVFAALLCFGMSLFIMYQQDLLGLLEYKKFMIISILRGGLFFIIPILLYFVLEIPGVVLGMAIASIIPSIPFFKNFKFKSFTNLKSRYRPIIQNFMVESSGLTVMLDKLLISSLFGFFIVGVYQFNLQIMLALQVLPGVLGSYLISEESRGEHHKKISYLVILCSVVVAILVIIFSSVLVNAFFPKYLEGVFSLQIMVLSIIPQTFASILIAKLLSKESTKVGFVSLIHVGSLLALITVLGQFYGMEGLALAVLFSTIIYTVFLYWIYRKYHALSSIV